MTLLHRVDSSSNHVSNAFKTSRQSSSDGMPAPINAGEMANTIAHTLTTAGHDRSGSVIIDSASNAPGLISMVLSAALVSTSDTTPSPTGHAIAEQPSSTIETVKALETRNSPDAYQESATLPPGSAISTQSRIFTSAATPAIEDSTVIGGLAAFVTVAVQTQAQAQAQGQYELSVGPSITTLSSLNAPLPIVSTYSLAGQVVVASASSLYLAASSDSQGSSASQLSLLTASINAAGSTLLAIGSSTLTLPGPVTPASASTFVFAGQTFVQSAEGLVLGTHTLVPDAPVTLQDIGTSRLSNTISDNYAVTSSLSGIGDYIMSGLAPGPLASDAANSSSTSLGSKSNTDVPQQQAHSAGIRRAASGLVATSVALLVAFMLIS